MSLKEIEDTVSMFIRTNFIFDTKKTLDADQSLMETGVIDSTGVLELIAFLEQTFSVKFHDEDLVAANFDSVRKIAACVSQKTLGPGA